MTAGSWTAMSLRTRLSRRGIELGAEIGHGAAAVVYRAVDRRHGRAVAVKVFRPGPGMAPKEDRFLREIRLAAGLQHPHILPVYDSGIVDGTPFYVMPYVEGESLRQRVEREGRLPLDESLRIAREVADGLAYAHAHGVVHRDIKPENILLEGKHAVVADFGVALAVGRISTDPHRVTPRDENRLTAIGRIVGSPAYMSPEQASGDPALDGRSDIYSLGCVLYEMLAGEPPFHGASPREIVARRFLGSATPLRERNPEVPVEVSAAVQKALEVDPAARFARAEDFASALRQRQRPTLGRRRGWLRGRTLAAAGGVALAALVLLPGRQAPPGAPRLDPRRVAVAALSNETGDSGLAPVGRLIAAWITDRLARARTFEVVTSATVLPAQHDTHTDGATDDPERLHALAAETRAGTIVTGSYYRGTGGAVEFHVEIVDANSGDLLRDIGPVYGKEPSERTADQLSRAVAGALDTLMQRAPPSPGASTAGRQAPGHG